MPAPSDPTDRLISPPGYFPSRRAEQRGEEQAAKLVLCRGIPTSRLPFPCSLGMVLRPKRNRRRLPPSEIDSSMPTFAISPEIGFEQSEQSQQAQRRVRSLGTDRQTVRRPCRSNPRALYRDMLRLAFCFEKFIPALAELFCFFLTGCY